MKNLVNAVLGVMEDCTGIDKGMTIGKGNFAYKGVSDKDVKLKVGESMRKHKLIILPVEITPIHKVDTWMETDQYGKEKQKQSIFTEVITKYRLIHESGEEAFIAGYGHGVDPQDKAAGKATTYALKYALLYSFLVATGHIDDTDNTHSNEIEVPKKVPNNSVKQEVVSVWESKKKAFITHMKKEASEINASGVPTEKASGLIDKAKNTYKATLEEIGSAMKEAGVTVELELS